MHMPFHFQPFGMSRYRVLRTVAFIMMSFILLLSACTGTTAPTVHQNAVAPQDPVPEDSAPDEISTSSTKPPPDTSVVTARMVGEGHATIAALLDEMTLEEKVGQMIQGERKTAWPQDVKKFHLGSILSGGGSVPGSNTREDWTHMIVQYQTAAEETRLGIPILYGVDAVHGHNNVAGAVIFPHNIGLGAANNPELMGQIGIATAVEVAATGVRWNFAPVVAPVMDIRWGRTYEGFSENPDRVTAMALPYLTGLQVSGRMAGTAKHYIADGATLWGTGDNRYAMDQGDAQMDEATLRAIHLPSYQKAIDAGVKTVMASFSSWNGVKHHENHYLLTDVLKGELGFEGFVVSDWEAIHQLTGNNFGEQIAHAVNAGVDMLMEPNRWLECHRALLQAVQGGTIPLSRIDDAVARILRVKWEIGLFETPVGTQEDLSMTLGSEPVRELARQAVRESLVLLKNEGNLLPVPSGTIIFMTGPGLNNVGLQCGGWTLTWQGGQDSARGKHVPGTTVLEGFEALAMRHEGTILTSPEEAHMADMAIVVLAEVPYAEGSGDDNLLTLYDGKAHPGNGAALNEVAVTGLPTVVVLLSGRPRLVTKELPNWDALVAAWLPGTEGKGIAEVLYGEAPFVGTLPFTWPADAEQPGNPDPSGSPLFPYGYGILTNP